MEIQVNGKAREFTGIKEISLEDVLKKMDFPASHLVVTLNGDIIKEKNRSTTTVTQGDKIEAIGLVGGG